MFFILGKLNTRCKPLFARDTAGRKYSFLRKVVYNVNQGQTCALLINSPTSSLTVTSFLLDSKVFTLPQTCLRISPFSLNVTIIVLNSSVVEYSNVKRLQTDCNCPPTCTEIDYKAQMSSSQLSKFYAEGKAGELTASITDNISANI